MRWLCRPYVAVVRFPRACLVCLFFSCRVDRRDLHSFPTRRSSDLPALGLLRLAVIGPCVGTGNRTHLLQRSEEHTSELQSRENLVCRLLLEKKKRANGRGRSWTAGTMNEVESRVPRGRGTAVRSPV